MDDKDIAAEVAAFAELCDFPCSKQEMLQMADEQEFPDEVMDVLEEVQDKQFTCEESLIEAAQNVTEPISEGDQ